MTYLGRFSGVSYGVLMVVRVERGSEGRGSVLSSAYPDLLETFNSQEDALWVVVGQVDYSGD